MSGEVVPPVVVPPLPSPAPAEPGWATTEFWASQVTAVVAAVTATAADFGLFHLTTQQQHDVQVDSLLVLGFVEIGYAISRGIRKMGTPGS